MASLPSYQEATTRPDWLALAAPYVHFADHPSLCRVCRRSWSLFAPPLWTDILNAVRRSGLDPGDDLSWWFDFVFHRLGRVALATRALVRILDARGFAKHVYHFASDRDGSLVRESFRRALELLPRANSILIDGHADLDPHLLFTSLSLLPQRSARLLSIAGCPNHLPGDVFNSPFLQTLVYLDASGVPGSILPLLRPTLLPNLRVLKVRAREIDDAMLQTLARTFTHRLWSLDVSENKVTDASIDTLRDLCMPASPLRSGARFGVEGCLVSLPHGTSDHGQFFSIRESPSSGTFSHPERHFADAPGYVEDAGALDLRQTLRSDGASPMRSDSPAISARLLSQEEFEPGALDFCRSRGLTHLRLSCNRVSSLGIQKLLRTSTGHLEYLDCESMPLLPGCSSACKHWPVSVSLHGILGAAHLFRPVFSSNLRSVRIHHSFVTQVPTLEAGHLSPLACMYLAETSVLQRVEEAYPQAFVPDMNPRLSCLTLTCIPRRSAGPLVANLIGFIKLLSVQERVMQHEAAAAASCSPSWRTPNMLQGLRHLVLEFGRDPMEDGFTAPEDSAAEELMDGGEHGFSFFTGEGVENSRSANVASRPRTAAASPHSSAVASRCHPTESDRDRQDTVMHDGEWNGSPYSVPVWVGLHEPGSNAVLREYRRLVVDCRLRDGVGPATPSQILAGVPDQSYVFHTAWCAAVMPRELKPPAWEKLAGMKDVLVELKEHRRAGRAKYLQLQKQVGDWRAPGPLGEPHFFWTGTLRVSTTKDYSLARPVSSWD
ncbi:leucine rich repeat domain containing protein [Ophiocordyceps sinensis CO18]|uniref:Leucine rich repeat domain containing protein n=1 Tax=Ophiocordyceps sinensis (strain Co18 / CGMCC 3.14243) TaxID=911162 RepID=T5ANW4_OPHSC|nr:leucine rich repeat domain containing protein [Ophiocordyceps sinensis CO18]